MAIEFSTGRGRVVRWGDFLLGSPRHEGCAAAPNLQFSPLTSGQCNQGLGTLAAQCHLEVLRGRSLQVDQI